MRKSKFCKEKLKIISISMLTFGIFFTGSSFAEDNPDNLETVNHIDGNKTNNCKDNLEWCSYSDNEKHAWENNLNNSEATDKAVLQYTMNGTFVKEYKSCAEAVRETGIKHVHCAAKGARKSAGGYSWMYLEDYLEKFREVVKSA